MRSLVLVAVVAAMACGSVATGPPASESSSASPTGDATFNVHGTLDRGSTSAPPCPTGEPCDPPMVAIFVDFSKPDRADVRARIDASGAFAAHLDPGSYSISLAPPSFGGRVDPNQVLVPKNGMVLLHLVVRKTS